MARIPDIDYANRLLYPRVEKEGAVVSLEQKKYFESGVKHEQEGIIKLLKSELGAGAYLEDTEIRDNIIKYFIRLVEQRQK